MNNTNTHTNAQSQVDAGYEVSKFAFGVGLSMAALTGLWGAASLISALAGNGPVQLAKDLLTAIVGI